MMTTIEGNYEQIVAVQAHVGGENISAGVAGVCRYCVETDPRAFRNVAHTLPEGFGNKWVTSLDECDACNTRFAPYDDALAKSLGIILTVGGTKGKNNKVRQTGRSQGPLSVRHSVEDGQRRISVQAAVGSFGDHVQFNGAGEIVFTLPGGAERFVPVKAYKALVKMAVALLPPEELPKFSRIIAWLAEQDDHLLPEMTVGLSLAMIGNAPELLTAALLRRTSDDPDLPYMIFITTMGSICLQIDLKADVADGAWPAAGQHRPQIRWTNILNPPGHEPLHIVYDAPQHLDWGRNTLELPVVEALVSAYNPRTNQMRMSARLRESIKEAP